MVMYPTFQQPQALQSHPVLPSGFMGTDRLQIFVQGMRMQAAARATEPPKADFGMAIQVARRQKMWLKAMG